jgi:hypothetical protein
MQATVQELPCGCCCRSPCAEQHGVILGDGGVCQGQGLHSSNTNDNSKSIDNFVTYHVTGAAGVSDVVAQRCAAGMA